MASLSNISKDLQESLRDVLDRQVKLSIRNLVCQEIRADKTENKILAFSSTRVFVLTAKVPVKVELSLHFLDIQSIESRKSNQLTLTADGKSYTFRSLKVETDEINHMITHIGLSVKQVFPAFPLERLINQIDVYPVERLRMMRDMIKDVEKRDHGPCGGFSNMYSCMCDYHSLPKRDEVIWDIDTIYLSQDSRELCLKDFDHLDCRDLIPVISALEHNTWFTNFNASNVKLVPEACSELLKVMRRNAVLEELNLCNTGIKVDFAQKLSIALLSNMGSQLTRLDLSQNAIEDRGIQHLTGALAKLTRGLSELNLSRCSLSGKGVNRLAEGLASSRHMLGSLHTLNLSHNSMRGDDLTNLYSFLAQPNSLVHLDLSNTEVALDMLCGALVRGCCQKLVHLDASQNTFTHKRVKDAVVPPSWKQLFASVFSLQHLNFSSCKLPSEAIKELLLGISSNRDVQNLHLDISSNDLKGQGAQNVEAIISEVQQISSLNISDNDFGVHTASLLKYVVSNRGIRTLAIGQNFAGLKPKQLGVVLETLVHILQDEDSCLQSLSLADSKLRSDIAMVINALGSNASLTEIDISGNQMGDYGTRMLAKALQINSHLRTLYLDKNNISAQGFEDIASALEKNYMVKKMPLPLFDLSSSLKLYPERTEAAIAKIETFLQRNHSSSKFSADHAYRLQQGFLISSTQQFVDRLVVQVQDTINALCIDSTTSYQEDLETANELIEDAEKSRQILMKLQDIAMTTEKDGNPVQTKLAAVATELQQVLDAVLKNSVNEMIRSTESQCKAIMQNQEFRNELDSECNEKISLPKDFISVVMEIVNTDIYNKISELNLSIAAHISDRIMDEVIESLSRCFRALTNHLNLRKSGLFRAKEREKVGGSEKEEILITEEDKSMRVKTPQPTISVKRQSLHERKLRPQSVISKPDILDNAELTKSLEIDLGLLSDSMGSSIDTLNTSDGGSGAESLMHESGDGILTKSMSGSNSGLPVDLDAVSPTEGGSKLQHLNKARPKRAKAHVPIRPMTKPAGSSDNDLDEDADADTGMDLFYQKQQPLMQELSKQMSNQMSESSSSESITKPLPAVDQTDSIGSKPENKKKPKFNFSRSDKEKDKDKKDKGPSLTQGIQSFFSRKVSSSKQSTARDLSPASGKEPSGAVAVVKADASPVHVRSKPMAEPFKTENGKGCDFKEHAAKAPAEKEDATANADVVQSLPVALKPPAGIPKLGYGGGVLAEMKARQEKRQTKHIQESGDSLGNSPPVDPSRTVLIPKAKPRTDGMKPTGMVSPTSPKPMAALKPRPPPPTAKKPPVTPRSSVKSLTDLENVSDGLKSPPPSELSKSAPRSHEIITDSDTLKLSVKGKIQKLGLDENRNKDQETQLYENIDVEKQSQISVSSTGNTVLGETDKTISQDSEALSRPSRLSDVSDDKVSLPHGILSPESLSKSVDSASQIVNDKGEADSSETRDIDISTVVEDNRISSESQISSSSASDTRVSDLAEVSAPSETQNESKRDSGQVIVDSATLRLNVKDKIKKMGLDKPRFGTSANDKRSSLPRNSTSPKQLPGFADDEVCAKSLVIEQTVTNMVSQELATAESEHSLGSSETSVVTPSIEQKDNPLDSNQRLSNGVDNTVPDWLSSSDTSSQGNKDEQNSDNNAGAENTDKSDSSDDLSLKQDDSGNMTPKEEMVKEGEVIFL